MTEELTGIGEPETPGEGSPTLFKHPEIGEAVDPPAPKPGRYYPSPGDNVRVVGEDPTKLWTVDGFDQKGNRTYACLTDPDGPEAWRKVAVSNLAEPLKRQPKAPEPKVVRYGDDLGYVVGGEGPAAQLTTKHPANRAVNMGTDGVDTLTAFNSSLHAEQSFSARAHEEAALAHLTAASRVRFAATAHVAPQELMDRLLNRVAPVRVEPHPHLQAALHHILMAEELTLRPRRPKKG